VENAKVTIEMTESSRKYDTKTNKKGEFIQIGLTSGGYKVTAEKDKVVSNTQEVRVRVGSAAEANLVLGAAAAAAMGKEVAAKTAELKKTFEEGVTASRADNHDEAIAAFTK